MIRRLAPLVFLLAFGCAAPAARPDIAPAPAAADAQRDAAATITPQDMSARIGFLASDALRGRDTPSQGLEAAAAYIRSEFQRMGLEPGVDAGSYLQRWEFPVTRLTQTGVQMRFESPRRTIELRHGTDFVADRGAPDRVSGGLVFIGPASDQSMSVPGEVRDRVAVVFIAGRYDRDWRLLTTRVRRLAQEGGAAAVMFVLDPAFTSDEIQVLQQRFGASGGRLGGLRDITTWYIAYESARDLFRIADLDLDGLRQLSGAESSRPVPLAGVTAALIAPVEVLRAGNPANVVGVLRGSDPDLRESYVVISAHYDHVGVGTPDARGDSIYNGADDNASGTAAVLGIAGAFAAMPTVPRRSIIFLLVSGEEKGLLGSRYYSDNPTVPSGQIVANVNIDMISRNAADSIVVLGQEYSSLGTLVQRVNQRHPELGLTVAEDIWPQERFFFRSDHFNFVRLEIPALFFFSGVHEDYHRPSDTVDRIDSDKGARVSRLIFHTIAEIANDPERPRWSEEGLAEVRRLTR